MDLSYPITWFYYTNLEAVIPFYRDILGLPLVLDQGWAKIFKLNEHAFVGLVDEKKGSLKAAEQKPVLLTLVVEDVDEWHTYLKGKGVPELTSPELHEDIGVYGFFFEDPAGYKIEIQKFLEGWGIE